MKKVLSLLFIAAMVLGCLIPTASATTNVVPEGYTAIDSVDAFIEMTDGNYILTDDIDFGTYNEGTPFTNYVVQYFSGTLDGNGHVLKNIKIDASADGGIFQVLASNAATTIKNLTIDNITIVGAGEITLGCLAGYNNKTNLTTIENVTLKGVNVTGNVRACGGFLGAALLTNIRNCSVDGSFSITSSARTHLGGFIGETKNAATNIYDSANYADCSIISPINPEASYISAGGFIGVSLEHDDTATSIYNSANFGNVNNGENGANNKYCSGGFLGLALGKKASTIDGFVNFGKIEGGYHNSGIVAWNAYTPYTIQNSIVYGSTSRQCGCADKNTDVNLVCWKQTGVTITNCLDKTSTSFAQGTSSDVAIFGVQESVPTSNAFNLRVSATLKNTANYNEVGFEVTTYVMKNGVYELKENKSVKCENVYKTLSGKTENGISKSYTAEEKGADYLFALTLKGVPVSEGDSVLVIARPYAVPKEGDKVFGGYTAALWSANGFVAIDNLA